MAQVSRYNRQELVSLVGKAGQGKLRKSEVAVIGLGALGSVAACLLTRAGVGSLRLIDRDIVELTDLQRQLLYDQDDIGRPKAAAAAAKLRKTNSEVEITALTEDVEHKTIASVVRKPDVVLDCTDNLETRFLINEYCLKNRLAWVHAAAIMVSGQLMVFNFGEQLPESPCFACVFGRSAVNETCDTAGVLTAATTAVATMQVTEAVKLLIGRHKDAVEGLVRLDSWNHKISKIRAVKQPSCPSCGSGSYPYLSGRMGSGLVMLCGRGSYQIKGRPVNLAVLKTRLGKSGRVDDFGDCIRYRNLTVFRNGRVLVKAGSANAAKSAYSRYLGL